MKAQWIDIMFNSRFHRKFKYKINTCLTTWAEDLKDYVLKQYLYLTKRREFQLWFNLPNVSDPVSLTIRPSRAKEV